METVGGLEEEVVVVVEVVEVVVEVVEEDTEVRELPDTDQQSATKKRTMTSISL